MTRVTKRYYFPASHRLHSPKLTEAENARLYGKCNNPFGHGHDYTLEVTAAGTIDRNTGLLVARAKLDRLVEMEVLRVFSYRNLNLDLPYFQNLVPTTENIALTIVDILTQNWSAYLGDSPVWLHRVGIDETGRNAFEVFLGVREENPSGHSQVEEAVHA